MNKTVIPAIIPKSIDEIINVEEKLRGKVNSFQVDVVDGIFAKPASWPHTVEGFNNVQEIKKLIDNVFLEFEVDMMVKDVTPWIPFWIDAGAQKFIFHYASQENIEELFKSIRIVKNSGRAASVALTINDNPDNIKEIIGTIDSIQCMGINKIGVQGEKLNKDVCQLIATTKILYDKEITVDGGVNLENAEMLLESGATTLVSGSAIFKDEKKVFENINKFNDIIEKYNK